MVYVAVRMRFQSKRVLTDFLVETRFDWKRILTATYSINIVDLQEILDEENLNWILGRILIT